MVLGRIPQFKPIPVSDIFKEYLIDVMNGGKHNQRHHENIPVEERKIWEKIVNGAGLAEHLKIKKSSIFWQIYYYYYLHFYPYHCAAQ